MFCILYTSRFALFYYYLAIDRAAHIDESLSKQCPVRQTRHTGITIGQLTIEIRERMFYMSFNLRSIFLQRHIVLRFVLTDKKFRYLYWKWVDHHTFVPPVQSTSPGNIVVRGTTLTCMPVDLKLFLL